MSGSEKKCYEGKLGELQLNLDHFDLNKSLYNRSWYFEERAGFVMFLLLLLVFLMDLLNSIYISLPLNDCLYCVFSYFCFMCISCLESWTGKGGGGSRQTDR